MINVKAGEHMYDSENKSLFCNARALDENVNIPIELYESVKGCYYIGYADNLNFGQSKSAWARLYNPRESGVNLFVNVWTVTDISSSPFRAQFWFNSSPPGAYSESTNVTPSNTAYRPKPRPKVRLQQASNVVGEPIGGVKAFVRRGEPGTTVVETENGKLIFPPGGSFLVFISLAENETKTAEGRIAFGWWEQKICDCY